MRPTSHRLAVTISKIALSRCAATGRNILHRPSHHSLSLVSSRIDRMLSKLGINKDNEFVVYPGILDPPSPFPGPSGGMAIDRPAFWRSLFGAPSPIVQDPTQGLRSVKLHNPGVQGEELCRPTHLTIQQCLSLHRNVVASIRRALSTLGWCVEHLSMPFGLLYQSAR